MILRSGKHYSYNGDILPCFVYCLLLDLKLIIANHLKIQLECEKRHCEFVVLWEMVVNFLGNQPKGLNQETTVLLELITMDNMNPYKMLPVVGLFPYRREVENDCYKLRHTGYGND